MANWGGGWVYAPDYYPSGELLFQTGAGSNAGSYSDKKNDALIHDTNFGDATLAACRTTSLSSSGRLAAEHGLPDHRDPEESQGVVPQNPLHHLNPENWYFTK